MIDEPTIIAVTFVAVFLLQTIFEEIRSRRQASLVADLLRKIGSLENKLTAKDISGYIALEEQDRPVAPPASVVLDQEREFAKTSDDRYFGGNVVYDDQA